MTEQARSDIYQTITDHIIAAIEAGAGDWKMPRHVKDGGTSTPINAVTNRPYRGVNVIMLWTIAHSAGYSSPIWGTYKQWAELGVQVRKGEKAAPIVFWKQLQDEKAEEQDDDETQRARFIAKGFHVFNADQVDGFEAPTLPLVPQSERIAHADAFFSRIGADIRHGGSRAYYSPAYDHIQLPPFAAFGEPTAYYATLAHETVHWAGHGSRCARELKGKFGSESYAAEELVAELGAAFLCADLALASEPRPDHAAYVASWLKVLKGDKRAIFTASALAQKAADWLHNQATERDQKAA
jgi:antirestriction protein ArdC